MALVKDTNCYVDVAEADLYFANRIDVATWDEASPLVKAKALVTATNMIEDIAWTGTISDEDQALSFPREGDYYEPKLGYYTALPSSYPNRISTGNIELAYHLINNEGVLDLTMVPENIKVEGIELEGIDSMDNLPSIVYNLFKPLRASAVSGVSGSMWWRAN